MDSSSHQVRAVRLGVARPRPERGPARLQVSAARLGVSRPRPEDAQARHQVCGPKPDHIRTRHQVRSPKPCVSPPRLEGSRPRHQAPNCNLERGVKVPSLTTILRLAEALDYRVVDLVRVFDKASR